MEDNEETDISEDSEPDDLTDRVLRSSSRSPRDVSECRCKAVTCRCKIVTKAPPTNAKLATRPKWLPPGYKLQDLKLRGNPVFGFRMQLYCRTRFYLGIFPDKKVKGIDIEGHRCAMVEFSSVDFGEVRIRGIETNLYLAMNQKGRLYGEVNGKDEATVFVEYSYGQYNLYLSRKWAHVGWYVGIKKSGKIKPGPQTRWGQKAIQFLPQRNRSI